MTDIDYKAEYARLYSLVQELYITAASNVNNMAEAKIKVFADKAVPPEASLDAKIIAYVANGLNTFEIGTLLDISHRTVEGTLLRLRHKYGAKNTHQLQSIFFRNGWLK